MKMSPNITPEEIELIKSAKEGSEKAFSKLFKKYKGFVDNLLYGFIKDHDEARDLTNIVFLKVYNNLSKFTAYSSFGGWLRILSKNTAIDYLRTVKDYKMPIDAEDYRLQTLSSSGNVETEYINKMTYEDILSKLDALPASYRKVCELYYVENMTVAQISEALDMPCGTIKSNLHRLRNILKTKLKV